MSQKQPLPSSLSGAAAKIGGGTLVSRLLGFARDLLIARIFGADQTTDAFFVAFRLPNLMRRLFAEGAFAAALVPVLARAERSRRTRRADGELVSELTGSLTTLLLIGTCIGVLCAPLLVLLFAPGFSGDAAQRTLTIELVQLTLPYFFFIGLTALAGAVLNAFEHFTIPALTPALLNLSLIGCTLFLAPQLAHPIFALAWGVLIGGVAQLAFQFPALARLGLLKAPRINWRNPVLQRFFATMSPTLVGMSIIQINLLIDTLLASFLVAGSISWLYYGERLMDFPLGILGAALGTAILPRLSRTHKAGDTQAFSNTLDWALRWVLTLGAPAAVGLLLLAEPTITTLFFSQEFGADDVSRAGWSLMAYALGLPAFMAIKILLPSFFSRDDVKTPLRIGMTTIGANLALSLLLMPLLGHTGLALATSVTAYFAMVAFIRALARIEQTELRPGWTWLLLRILLSALIMGSVIAWVLWQLPPWIQLAPSARLLGLASLITIGALSYLLTLLALGVRPRTLSPRNHPEHPPSRMPDG